MGSELYFHAQVLSYTDYYPFGMEMVGRAWSEGEGYRFGHNGQEKSREVGEDNYTAEFWEYDSQTIRRFNIDPVVKEYESPYLAFSGNPIWFLDVKGDDAKPIKPKKIVTGNRVIDVFVTPISSKDAKLSEASYSDIKCIEKNQSSTLILMKVKDFSDMCKQIEKLKESNSYTFEVRLFINQHGSGDPTERSTSVGMERFSKEDSKEHNENIKQFSTLKKLKSKGIIITDIFLLSCNSAGFSEEQNKGLCGKIAELSGANVYAGKYGLQQYNIADSEWQAKYLSLGKIKCVDSACETNKFAFIKITPTQKITQIKDIKISINSWLYRGSGGFRVDFKY